MMDHDTHAPSSGDHAHDGVSDRLVLKCPVCKSTSRLLKCGACRVVSYCGPAHQAAHRPDHKAACNAVKKACQRLEHEEAALRAGSDGNLFDIGVGRFWGIVETRDYMTARFAVASALLKIDTVPAVEGALDHLFDMLRLCRGDNMGVRNYIPGLLMRLGRDQECYDFIKWWATIDDKDHYNGHYDWSDTTLPYLDIHGADVFEPVDVLCSRIVSLGYLVMLTLLKLRLRLDLEAYASGSDSSTASGRRIGKLARARVQTLDRQQIATTVKALTEQYHQLCRAVNDANPHFWNALIDEEDEDNTLPPFYARGTIEEARLVLDQCAKAWRESKDAMVVIKADARKLKKPGM